MTRLLEVVLSRTYIIIITSLLYYLYYHAQTESKARRKKEKILGKVVHTHIPCVMKALENLINFEML